MSMGATIVSFGSISLGPDDIQAGTYFVDQNPLAASAERNMAGTLVEQFLGFFPSVNFTTMPMSYAEAKTFLAALKNRSIAVTYFDTFLNANKTINMYPAPLSATALNDCIHDGIEVSLTAIAAANYY